MYTTVKMLMTPNPAMIDSDSTLMEAARKMEEMDCGILPVGSEDRLEGIITDRDIVIRAISRGMNVHATPVRDYMTTDIYYCREDDTLEKAADLMRQHHVNRLVVKDSAGRVSGLITFGGILRKDSDIREISEVVERAVGRKVA